MFLPTEEKRKAFAELVEYLESKYDYNPWWNNYTPFQNLVGIIISQRTNIRNGIKAFSRLLSENLDDVDAIRNTDTRKIEELIKCAGMAKAKARTIKALAEFIFEKYGGDFEKILYKNIEDIRNELLSIKGVGPKTVDVFLMIYSDEGILPVDTHIYRISIRLGIARKGASYEETRTSLEELISSEKRKKAHILLIEFGRNICRARDPLCERCPVRIHCDFSRGDEDG